MHRLNLWYTQYGRCQHSLIVVAGMALVVGELDLGKPGTGDGVAPC